MTIKHDAEVAAEITAGFTGELHQLKSFIKAKEASYSNLYGVTKGITANNKYFDLITVYKASFISFSSKINEVSQAFEALDQSEATNFKGDS